LNCEFTLLPDEGLLEISGPDTLTFLQGQVTCDTRELSDNNAVPGVYCTPKGRTVADFLLLQLAEAQFALRLRSGIVEHTAAVLGKYIVFSKAEIAPRNAQWQIFGCWGQDAAQVITDISGAVSGQQYACISAEDFIAVQMDEGGRYFECYCKTESSLPQRLADNCQAGTASDWHSAQIASGIARIEADTVEEFIPQMLNYDITGHISFTKGCYTGQEVVARLHYRGKPKRRTYVGSIAGADVPVAGTPLFTPGNNQSIGNIVNASGGNDQGVTVLYCATATAIDQGVRLGSDQGMEILPGDLPYPMSQETND
jgi:folate-binding protein YgfZ